MTLILRCLAGAQCGNCGSEAEGIRCEGHCRGCFHFGCLSITEEEVAEAREDGASRPRSSDRCLALSSAVQEFLHTVKIFNERLHSLEANNQDLTRRLELVENQSTRNKPNGRYGHGNLSSGRKYFQHTRL